MVHLIHLPDSSIAAVCVGRIALTAVRHHSWGAVELFGAHRVHPNALRSAGFMHIVEQQGDQHESSKHLWQRPETSFRLEFCSKWSDRRESPGNRSSRLENSEAQKGQTRIICKFATKRSERSVIYKSTRRESRNNWQETESPIHRTKFVCKFERFQKNFGLRFGRFGLEEESLTGITCWRGETIWVIEALNPLLSIQ